MSSSSSVIFLLIINSLISLTVADNTVTNETIDNFTKINIVPRLYDEIGCKKIVETFTNGSKFTRFDCPDFNELADDKCHLKGKVYNVSEYADKTDLPFCTAQCICLKRDNESARFDCAEIECPEQFEARDWSCKSQYDHINDCCQTREICDHGKMTKMPTCNVDGISYTEGERIYPDNEPCYTCLCADGWNSSIEISKNPNCQPIDCRFELHYSMNKIRNGCIPVYLDKRCCPIDYRCPSDDDIIITANNSTSNETNKDDDNKLICIFGKLTMKLGDKLNTNACTTCECSIPPFASCITTNNC